jgi:hypothetical protein
MIQVEQSCRSRFFVPNIQWEFKSTLGSIPEQAYPLPQGVIEAALTIKGLGNRPLHLNCNFRTTKNHREKTQKFGFYPIR